MQIAEQERGLNFLMAMSKAQYKFKYERRAPNLKPKNLFDYLYLALCADAGQSHARAALSLVPPPPQLATVGEIRAAGKALAERSQPGGTWECFAFQATEIWYYVVLTEDGPASLRLQLTPRGAFVKVYIGVCPMPIYERTAAALRTSPHRLHLN